MKIISKNKRAYHDYDIEKTYDVGIVLKGHEVKAIKSSQVNIKDAIIRLDNRELWIINMDIPLYKKTSPIMAGNYQPKGRRKLLITKKELGKISSKLDNTSYVMLPLSIFVTKNGLIKLRIGLGKRLRKVEKKQILKEKDIKRQMDRDIKHMAR